MPRPPRIYLENCLYYVTSVSSYEGFGQACFYDDEDYQNYINLLNRYKKEFGFKLFAYALLPSRLHLLIELKNEVTISTIMHALNSTYTKIYNSRYGKKGHLFQERFRSVLVDKDSYLLRLTAHMHSAPARLGLVESPREYRHTSLGCYLGQCNPALDLAEEVRELFGRIQSADTRAEYAAYVGAFSKKNKESEGFERLFQHKRVVGSRDFVMLVREEMARSARQIARKRAGRPVPFFPILGYAAAGLLIGTAALLGWPSLSALWENSVAPATVAERPAVPAPLADGPKVEVQIVYRERLEPYNLDGSVWDIELTELHTGENDPAQIVRDRLKFQNQVVASKVLGKSGIPPSRYVIRKTRPDLTVWESVQTNERGEVVRWHGEWDGRNLKGFMTQHAAEGISREFSFTGVRVNLNG